MTEEKKALALKLTTLQCSMDSINSFLSASDLFDENGDCAEEKDKSSESRVIKKKLSQETEFDEKGIRFKFDPSIRRTRQKNGSIVSSAAVTTAQPSRLTMSQNNELKSLEDKLKSPRERSAFSVPAGIVAGRSQSRSRSPGIARGSPDSMTDIIGGSTRRNSFDLQMTDAYLAEKTQYLDSVFGMLDQESPQFASVRQGLAASIAALNISIVENAQNWRFINAELAREIRQREELEVEASGLQANVSGMAEGKSQYLITTETFKRNEEVLAKKLAVLEADMRQLQHNYNQAMVLGHAAAEKVQGFDSIRDGLELQIDKLKHDNELLGAEVFELQSAKNELTRDIESVVTEYTMLQSHSDELMQELGVLEAEREEFYRRFLKEPPPPSRHAYVHHRSSFDGEYELNTNSMNDDDSYIY